MTKRRKLIWWVGSSLAVLMGIVLVVYFYSRQALLEKAVDKVESTFAQRFGGELQIARAQFSDWRSVRLEDISLRSPEQDTLFTLQALEIKLRVWPLFSGKVLPAAVQMHHGGLHLVYCDSLDNNFNWLLRQKPEQINKTNKKQTSLSDRLASLINAAFRWLPDQLYMEDIGLRVQVKNNDYAFVADTVQMEGGRFYTSFETSSPYLKQQGQLNGTVDRKKRSFDLVVSGKNDGWLTLPAVWEEAGLWTALADARWSISNIRAQGGTLQLHMEVETDRLFMAHPKLSDTTVTLPYLAFKGDWRIGAGDITLDSTSTFSVDRIDGNVGGTVQIRPGKSIGFMLSIPPVDAQDFMTSLPGGMFHNLEGLQVEGKLNYRFELFIDQDSLELSYLNSRLTSDQFKINAFGKTDLRMLNSSFTHDVFEDDRLVAQFLVGPENPNFVPYESISPFVKNAILTCEDPSFFSHGGFLEGAISESMVHNLKAKRFARGGSTISMQLVKNVFLNRKKFIARKLEEILLVWLIEGQHISSKQRMFEVYLNLIEWGPGVYGIGPAAQFYFGKNQSALTLSESIYLASIVPRPKKFRWYFDGDSLRPEWSDFNQFIAGRMTQRGLIEAVDSTTFNGQVKLTGPAGGYLVVKDSLDTDSLDLRPADLLLQD